MGAFDDLIPASTQQAAPQGGGMFDDLIPQQQQARPRFENIEEPNWIERQIAKLPDIVSPKEESQLRSFAMGAADPSVGAAQLLANTRLFGGKAAESVNEAIRQKEAEALAQREAVGREGFDAYRMGGNIASPPFMAAMRIPAASSVMGRPWLGRVLQGGAIGAGAGAVSPVTDEDFLATKAAQVGGGAALGAAIPGGIELGRYGAGRLKNLIDPWLPGGIERAVGRTGVAAAGKDAASIQRELEEAGRPFIGPQLPGETRRVMGEIVPGSVPTAGEVAARTGNAEFAGLQKITQGRLPTEYAGRDIGNEAARAGAIRSIGKSKAELQAAELLRSGTALQAYKKAFEHQVKADPELVKLSSNPYFKDGIKEASKIAAARGINPKENLTEFLHLIKIGIDSQLRKTGDDALSSTSKEQAVKVQKQLVEWLGKKNKPYEQARAKFAEQSIPINRMQVGQELEKSLINPMGTAERPASFANAVRNAPQTIKRATGQPRYDELGQVLDPRQTQSVGNVLEDLQRTADYERLAKSGSERARELVGQIEPKVPAAGMFNPKYSVFRAISNRLAGRVEGKSLDALADAMFDPAKMARLMKNATPADRKLIVNELMSQGERALATQAIMGISRESQ